MVGAFNLAEVVVSGATHLLDGSLAQATVETLRNRTMAEFYGDLTVRMTTLGDDTVRHGAAVMVLSEQLAVAIGPHREICQQLRTVTGFGRGAVGNATPSARAVLRGRGW